MTYQEFKAKTVSFVNNHLDLMSVEISGDEFVVTQNVQGADGGTETESPDEYEHDIIYPEDFSFYDDLGLTKEQVKSILPKWVERNYYEEEDHGNWHDRVEFSIPLKALYDASQG